ncbi:ABC transporter permease [Fulvivirga sp. M361]|uniref:ABC transporter permease n=1 Tax=Fulvivirga sp. M361 TaxID=2594266 RepID=UPI00117AA947|nr:ABC transporter permease [Fulvivirga sp. M361]TRX52058.1 ABC transporter permease [Fulvivirga sp. M361]
MISQDQITPPKWSLKLLRYFVKERYLEEIEGDMEEEFHKNLDRCSIKKAKLIYCLEVLKLMRPTIIKNLGGDRYGNRYDLVKNNFIVAFRSLKKKKLFTVINVLGLALALTLNAFLFLWVGSEFSYDSFHKHADRTYRVCSNISLAGQDFSSCMAPPPLADKLIREFPEVEDATRIWNWQNISVTHFEESGDPKIYNEDFVFEADSNFFQFFDFKLLQGNPDHILNDKWTVVLSESIAKKYYGNDVLERDDIIGKVIQITLWGNDIMSTVVGIAEDAPQNSHFHYNILLSTYSDPWSTSQAWTDNTYYTYVKLREEVHPGVTEAKFPDFIKVNVAPK